MNKVKVHVLLKDDVLDPQGKTVNRALSNMGYEGISNMRIGRYIEFVIESCDEKELNKKVHEMCKTVLSNPVIEKYEFTLEAIES